ncbi:MULTISPECIES: CdaR family transcriptional regulator [unclassified Amycolatopsis]|uniref:PucR family transcriptional regulator n=1 Tax=unclassified Amycolatopsis TaxID=2618356 RepID=UPI00106E3790|nr:MULTISPECIES: helix-turn-helix domain-containing protein [unclassified Amycolatopsis]
MDDDVPRLSTLPADTTSVLRLIAYFDALSGLAPDAVVRSAALVAGCPVGAVIDGESVWFDGAGSPVSGPSLDDVQIDRPAPHPLDVVLLDQLRRALRATRLTSPLRLGEPGLLEIAVSDREQRRDRLRALHLLGYDLDQPVVALVLAGAPEEGLDALARAGAGRLQHHRLGRLTLALTQGGPAPRELAGHLHDDLATLHPASTGLDRAMDVWIGLGEPAAAADAPVSWQQARTALRFASSTVFGRRAVPYGPLGVLVLLAELPPSRLAVTPGVAALEAHARTPGGALDVEALESYCVFGALRRTATELNLHHSTVAARLDRIEAATGWRLEDAMDRFQATFALLARRLVTSDRTLGDVG